MDAVINNELGVRYYLNKERRMVMLDSGYQIASPVYYNDKPFVAAKTNGVPVEQHLYMRKIKEGRPGLYELDIVSFNSDLGNEIGLIVWNPEKYCYQVKNDDHCYPLSYISEYRVVGNFYEDPELLEAPKRETPNNTIDIYIKTLSDGKWEYKATFAGHEKIESGQFEGDHSEKYSLLWATIKALTDMKNHSHPVCVHSESETFTDLLAGDKLQLLSKSNFEVNGKKVSMAAGLKRLYEEITKFTSISAVCTCL